MYTIKHIFTLSESELSKICPQLYLFGSLTLKRYMVVYNLFINSLLIRDVYTINGKFLNYVFDSKDWTEFENYYTFAIKNCVKNYITGYFTTEAYAHRKQPWSEDKYKNYLKEKDSEINEVVQNIMKDNININDEKVYDYIVFFHKDIPRLNLMFEPLY